jgi:ribosomal-protein-alanine N-acetyltransferase
MKTPVLQSRRLKLEPRYAGHVTSAHVAWLNDPDVVKYSEQRHKKHTLKTEQEFVNEMASSPHDHIWSITKQVDAGIIGVITAHIDPNNPVANVGIMIGDKTAWRQNFGLEAWNAVTNWLFENGIHKVEAGCHYENKGMRRLAIKAGMTLEGVRHNHFMVDGEPQHLLLYGKTKPQTAKVEINVQGINHRDTGT